MWLTSEAKALSSDARIIPAIQYATQASIYPPENTAAELTTAQTVIISFLYALRQRDLPLINTLLEVSSTVPQIKSTFLSVWLRDDFCFPRGDVAICLSNLGRLLLDGLQFPWTVAATIAGLDVKYCVQECFVEADDTAALLLLSTMSNRVSEGIQADFAKGASTCGTQSDVLELLSKESQTNFMKHVSFQLPLERTSTGTQAGLLVHDRGILVKPEQTTTGVQTTDQEKFTLTSYIDKVTSTLSNSGSIQPLPQKPGNDQGLRTENRNGLPNLCFELGGNLPRAQAIDEDHSKPFPIASSCMRYGSLPFPLQNQRPCPSIDEHLLTIEDKSGLKAETAIVPQQKRRTHLSIIDPSTGRDLIKDYLSEKHILFKKDPADTPKNISSSESAPSAHPKREVGLTSTIAPSLTTERTSKVEDGTKIKGPVPDNKQLISKGMANELLYSAIQKDNPKSIVAAIYAGANVNDEGVMKKRPLHVAASAGRIEAAIELIQRGAEVDCLDSWGETPLFVASVAGHLLMAEVLVSAGANIDHRNSEGNRPLHTAASAGQLETVRLLLSSGAGVDCRGAALRTPLHLASIGGHLGVVGLLLDRGADPRAVDVNGQTPHSLAMFNQQNLVAEFLFYRCRQ